MTATTTATLGRFVWHELMTSDPIAAQSFYHDVIGWNTKKWDPSAGDYTMFTAGATPIGGVMSFTPDAAAMGVPPNWLAYIETPDVDATIDQAMKLGATVIVPVQDVPDVGRFAVLRDPQGAVFAAITSANPLAAETDPVPMEFSWHELVTTDMAAASEFYEAIFNWDKKGEFDMGAMGMYRTFGRDRFTYGGIMNKPDNMPAPPHWLHYISVSDSADAAAERIKKAGGTVMLEPTEVPGGDRIAVAMDPQGAAFAVHSKPAK